MYTMLSYLSLSLSDFLKTTFNLNEDIVCIQPLSNIGQSNVLNKIYLTLVNIERETGHGIQFSQNNISNSHSQRGTPSWMMNFYILFSSVFSDKQYEESLQILSTVFTYLQSNNTINLPQSSISFSIEPVNLSFNELSNLWSIMGGSYYPSILCKIRTLNVNSEEVKQLQRVINRKDVTI